MVVNPREEAERRLRRWLRDHYGVIGYSEALRLGASPKLIEYKARSGEWCRVYQGVYRDSAAPTGPYQDVRAAWVATGGCGVASHHSAAWLWGLLDRPPDRPELTVRRDGHDARGHAGLIIHRARDLDVSAAVNRNTILITNPLRTLVDVSSVAVPEKLTEAVDNAVATRLVTTAAIEAEIARLSRPGRDGVAVLRRHLAARGFNGAPEPSVLEAHTRRLILTTGIPLPGVEVRFGQEGEYRLDIAWTAILFAVEVDGYRWHFSPEHQRRDLDRRNLLQRNGWTLQVFNWHHILKQPSLVARQIVDTYRGLSSAR